MKRLTVTFFLLILLPLTLDARRNGEGFFIGVGAGAGYYSDGGATSDLKKIDPGYDMENISGSYKLYAGYKYNHELTLEGAYTGYGIYELEKDGNLTERFEPKSGAVYLNYGHDFWHNQLRPFAIIGVGLLWLDAQNNAIYNDEIFFSLHYGLGLLYTPRVLDGLGFRIAYDADWSRYDANSDSGLSGSYNNFLGTLYLGVQYKF